MFINTFFGRSVEFSNGLKVGFNWVHGSALQVALSPGDQADMRQLLRMAEKVRAWMGDGCTPDEMPRPAIAALAEFAGGTAAGMLDASPSVPA